MNLPAASITSASARRCLPEPGATLVIRSPVIVMVAFGITFSVAGSITVPFSMMVMLAGAANAPAATRAERRAVVMRSFTRESLIEYDREDKANLPLNDPAASHLRIRPFRGGPRRSGRLLQRCARAGDHH